MKLSLGIAAAALLASCASYDQLREREPAIAFHSEKTPDEYLGCITPAFAQIWPATTNLRDGDAWVVAVPHGGSYLATVTIRSAGSGSDVEYRQLNNLTKFEFGRARAAVPACK